MSGSKAWRIPVAMQAIFILPIIALIFIVPESPRWLAAHGRADDSLAVLARLQGKPITHQDVLLQHQEIQDAVALEVAIGSGTWSDLLKEDKIKSRRRLLIACSIQFFQQIGGINAIIFYAGNFFALVSDQGALLAGGLFTWFFIASFIPWFMIDTVGRRKLLLACISGMAMAFAIESALVWKTQADGSRVAGGVAIAVLFIYMGLFTVSHRERPGSLFSLPSDRLPRHHMVLRLGDSTTSPKAKGRCHIYGLQLAHQLHHRADRADRRGEHRIQVLYCTSTPPCRDADET